MDLDANGMQALSRADAVALLESGEVGRLVYTRRALPAIIPVNYAVRDGAVWIWTGPLSSLGQAPGADIRAVMPVRMAGPSREVDLDREFHPAVQIIET